MNVTTLQNAYYLSIAQTNIEKKKSIQIGQEVICKAYLKAQVIYNKSKSIKVKPLCKNRVYKVKKIDNKNVIIQDPNKKDPKKPNKNPQQGKMSPQQIKQLLENLNNEEKKTQKKLNAKKARGKKVKQEKDW